jgi:polysaccharide pyruvyl transferase WcaK-like protein
MNNNSTKDSIEGLSKKNQGRLRIGLISPYLGSNLGDTAIIESARSHLVRLFPTAEILLIVIDCDNVAKVHGLETFPLTAVPLPFYFTPVQSSTADHVGQAIHPGIPDAVPLRFRMRSLLKNLAGHLPMVLPAAKRIRDGLRSIRIEVPHLIQARQVVHGLDGLVIAGGGQFDDEWGGPWGHPYAMYKWVRLAHKAHVPVYFAGVGVCEINSFLTRFFLRGALARADRVSLRDEGSLEILRRLGISRELISCPDLAFGLPVGDSNQQFDRVTSALHTTIGLSPIIFSRPGSWPTAKTTLFDRYWREFTSFSVSLLDAGYSLRLFVTDSGDYRLAKKLHDQLTDAGYDEKRIQLFPLLKLEELIALMRTCDAVIASRLHGVLLSHLSGVPALGISYHRKVSAHMEDIGQERFSLDFRTFTASEALEALKRLLAERSAVISDITNACIEKNKDIEREFMPIGAALTLRTQ